MAHRDTAASALCRELGIRPVTLYRYVGPQRSVPVKPRRQARSTTVPGHRPTTRSKHHRYHRLGAWLESIPSTHIDMIRLQVPMLSRSRVPFRGKTSSAWMRLVPGRRPRTKCG